MDRSASSEAVGCRQDPDGFAATRVRCSEQENRQIHDRCAGGNAGSDGQVGDAVSGDACIMKKGRDCGPFFAFPTHCPSGGRTLQAQQRQSEGDEDRADQAVQPAHAARLAQQSAGAAGKGSNCGSSG
ncbi:hypothetical protein G6F58_013174 [Rhizopus delemar]|nr:hypothetical protein G6F58_013174 [Rhizopus delemar]